MPSGRRAAGAAELGARRDRVLAVLARLGLDRLAAVVAELHARGDLRLTVRAGDRGGRGLRLRVRAAVVTELRADGVGRLTLRARRGLRGRPALLTAALLLLALLAAAEGVRHHLP